MVGNSPRDWSVWYCDLYKSRYHACPACWICRFFFTALVIAPTIYVLTH